MEFKFKFKKSELIKNPQEYSRKIPLCVLAIFISKCNTAYENKEPIISDYIYDQIIDILKEKL